MVPQSKEGKTTQAQYSDVPQSNKGTKVDSHEEIVHKGQILVPTHASEEPLDEEYLRWCIEGIWEIFYRVSNISEAVRPKINIYEKCKIDLCGLSKLL